MPDGSLHRNTCRGTTNNCSGKGRNLEKVTGWRLDEGSSYQRLSSSYLNQSDRQHSYLNKWEVTQNFTFERSHGHKNDFKSSVTLTQNEDLDPYMVSQHQFLFSWLNMKCWTWPDLSDVWITYLIILCIITISPVNILIRSLSAAMTNLLEWNQRENIFSM